MALSTPPPPPDPSSTATTRPPFPDPSPPNSQALPFYPPPSRLPFNPNPNYPQLASLPLHPQDPAQFLYPVVSSGLGFVPGPGPPSRPPFVFPHPEPVQLQERPGYSGPIHLLASGPSSAANVGGGVMPGVVKGIPVSSFYRTKDLILQLTYCGVKLWICYVLETICTCMIMNLQLSSLKVSSSSTSISESNGHKDLRDRSRNDSLPVVRERKVKASDSASLYTLCRSWLRNGFPEEIQPHRFDTVKSLPRPLPLTLLDSDSTEKREDKEEENEDEGSVEHLSSKELLKRHVKHSKRVRSRLREERLQRITRYKTRLALLLPTVVEQTPQK